MNRSSLLFALLVSTPTLMFSQQAGQPAKPAAVVPAKIDINKATVSEFARLPGVGPELARRIVAYRRKHGPFRRVEDLLAIRGIGPKKWREIRHHLFVAPATSNGSG